MKLDQNRDLETRIREFASELGRVPTSSEVRALVGQLGLTRDSLTDLVEQMASATHSTSDPRTAAKMGPAGRTTARATRHQKAVGPSDAPDGARYLHVKDGDQTIRQDEPPGAVTTAALDQEPGSSPLTAVGDSLPTPSSDAAVRRLVDDLTDDWYRQGGRLSDDDVTRLVAKRGLSASQQVSALAGLADLGVRVEPAVSTALGDTHESTEALTSTALSADQLKDYLKAIGRTPLLFAEDEVRLGRAIQAGLNAAEALSDQARRHPDRGTRHLISVASAGQTAQRDLVQANLRLVVSIAKLRIYEGHGLELADRIQEGNIGLMRAAVKFDPNLGYKFSTYATWWIRQSIARGLADRGRLIRLPVHVVENLIRIRAARRRLTRQHGREPVTAELSQETGIVEPTVRAILDYDRPIVSLDADVVTTDGDITLGDLLSDAADVDGRNDPVECALASSLRRDLDELLGRTLDARARDILERRSGYEGGTIRTLDELGQDHNVTRERIRQIEKKSYAIVRNAPELRALYEYICDGGADDVRPPVERGERRADGPVTAARRAPM